MKLEGRNALVTGASRGIGRAVAMALAAEGAAVGLAARSESSLADVAGEIERSGGRAATIPLDVTSPESIADARRRFREALGPAHVLVNNAGIAESVKVQKMDDAHWQSHLDVNLTGTFRVTRAFLDELVDGKWGRIINVASTAGKVGYRYTAAYCASKHGVVGFTRALALELATAGVTVNAICPGFVDTDMSTEAARNIAEKTGGSVEDALAWIARQSPQNRLVQPEEVAAVAVMLASEDARGITGQAINVDGGAVVY